MADPTVSMLVATTLQNYHKQFADNVSNSQCGHRPYCAKATVSA